MPIFDYHNHLNPQEILEDRQMENLTRVWLGGDHYKWRAMRAMGFSEDLITGNADDYDKYLAFAETIENAIGNPLYHWTHLELQRYFDITTPLSRAAAKEIWDEANAKLQTKEFTVRNLILNQHVSHLCTTDDPVDDLHCHLALQKEDFACRVLPSFRPDRAVHLEAGFPGIRGKACRCRRQNDCIRGGYGACPLLPPRLLPLRRLRC